MKLSDRRDRLTVEKLAVDCLDVRDLHRVGTFPAPMEPRLHRRLEGSKFAVDVAGPRLQPDPLVCHARSAWLLGVCLPKKFDPLGSYRAGSFSGLREVESAVGVHDWRRVLLWWSS
jgi:hypothetical protein